MMEVIAATRNLVDLIEAQIVGISLFKPENNIHKIFAKPANVNDPFAGGKGDRAFTGMHGYLADLPVFGYEMLKKR